MRVLFSTAAATAATAVAATAVDGNQVAGDIPNMNGNYTIGNQPSGLGVQFDTAHAHYGPTAAPVEWFEIYSPPIRSQYSQVYWTMQDAVPLPKDIVERFDGKVMAVTGYEADQVCTRGLRFRVIVESCPCYFISCHVHLG